MKSYEIVNYTPPISIKWRELEKLEIGQGFLVPWTDLKQYASPHSTLTGAAMRYGKILGRRFCTKKDLDGMWLYRKY